MWTVNFLMFKLVLEKAEEPEIKLPTSAGWWKKQGSSRKTSISALLIWTVKKAERLRIDAFEMWCWRRLLRVPWTARRSNQSILKEISPGISLEGIMLKLKLQYFGHLMWRVDSLERTLMLGGTGGQEEKGTTEDEMAGWHYWLNGCDSEWTPGIGDGQGGLVCCDSWGRKELDMTEQLIWSDLTVVETFLMGFMG